LCDLLAQGVPGVDLAALKRAAYLAKADLLSNMVREKEYTSLQGVMGGVYAVRQGEPEPVGQAVGEHYAPRSLGDPLPKTVEGRLLSVADKVDNISAAFTTGEIPTGSEDPYAVRRQATGVLQIILDSGWHLDVNAILRRCLALQGNKEAEVKEKAEEELAVELEDFMRERLNLLLADRGIRYDVAKAVLATSARDPVDALLRCAALAEFRAGDDFEHLVIGQKRVTNILRGIQIQVNVDAKLLVEPAEASLYNEARILEPTLAESVAARDYHRAMTLLLSLRPEIDRFFEDVMVMCEDKILSANRLGLLAGVKTLFLKVADLSQIVIEARQCS
jgi:glycyl-tRNA synthetase beta chain